jgi:hypothetical protein
MISFYHDRLAPPALCRLLYEALPERLHVPVIFSYGHQHMPRHLRGVLGATDHKHVYLDLEAIAFEARHYVGGRRAAVWRRMLETALHEFGHIAKNHWRVNKPSDEDMQFSASARDYYWCRERAADAWANRTMAAILRVDSRLAQPNYLGVVDLIYLRERRAHRKSESTALDWWGLKDYRCYRTGGQLSVSDVARLVLHDDRPIRLIHRWGDDLARVYTDRAGRKHHFWVWGDVPTIAQRMHAAGVQFEPKPYERQREAMAAPADSVDGDSNSKIPYSAVSPCDSGAVWVLFSDR